MKRLLAFLLTFSALAAQETTGPASVRTIAPRSVGDAANYTFPGKTEPYESARIFTRATGIVRERRVDIGDRVKEGDELAVIDVPDLDREVESAKAAVEQAEVRAANARSQAKRAEGLLARKAISQEDSDQRAAEAEAVAAAVRVAQADLARLEEQQRFAVVRAPFDATIVARNFDRGDRVRGDSATSEGWLFQVARLSVLRFPIQVTPDLAMRLTSDTQATVTFNELPGRRFTSTIARRSGVFDTITGTMRVELEIENKDFLLPAGLSGTAVLAVPPAPGTWLVPSNTVVTRAGQPTLATVDGGKVTFLTVATGRNLGPNIEVSSGQLNDQTQVIINPNALLQEGDTVTVAQAGS